MLSQAERRGRGQSLCISGWAELADKYGASY